MHIKSVASMEKYETRMVLASMISVYLYAAAVPSDTCEKGDKCLLEW